MDNPVGRKAKVTEEKVTDTEVKYEIKHWIPHQHCKLLTKLPFNPLRKAAEIDEGDDSDDIANCTNNKDYTNNG